MPQFVPLNGVHADTCFLRIGAVHVYKWSAFTVLFNGSLYGKKIKLSVTSAYIECLTGKLYT